MKVRLLAYTPEPEKVVAYSANLCYSKSDIESTVTKFYDSNEIVRLIALLKDKGHFSPFEHISFTFGIENISRVTSHQLVRHRIASYSQQSQRYVKYSEKNFDYITPPSIKKSEFLDEYTAYIEQGKKLYRDMTGKGIPKEDARYIFSNATSTNIIVTMNARSLFNFFKMRCCYHAQWEIRSMAFRMLSLVKDIAPHVFEKSGPSCFSGFCSENDPHCPLYKKNIK